jgi:hypothetical protein
MRSSERRRVLLASALTVAAIPVLIIVNAADGDEAADGVAGTTAETAPEFSTTPENPVFLDNTVPVVPPAVIDIAQPAPLAERTFDGTASFKLYEANTIDRPCTFPKAPRGAILTVTNIDNGLSTTCTNTLGESAPRDADLGLDTNVFIVIADLVDAPVPVRVTW